MNHAYRAGGSFRVYAYANCHCPHLDGASARKGHQVEVEGLWDPSTNGPVDPHIDWAGEYGSRQGTRVQWIVEAVDDDAQRMDITIDWGDGSRKTWQRIEEDELPDLRYPRVWVTSFIKAHDYGTDGIFQVTTTIVTMGADGEDRQSVTSEDQVWISGEINAPPPGETRQLTDAPHSPRSGVTVSGRLVTSGTTYHLDVPALE